MEKCNINDLINDRAGNQGAIFATNGHLFKYEMNILRGLECKLFNAKRESVF